MLVMLLVVILLALFHIIHSVDIITTIAGTGSSSYSGDGGQATNAAFTPYGIVIDSSGNVYFNDLFNNRVRKITISTGIISTYTGTGASSYSGDGGQATSASMYKPNGLCIDTSGMNITYINFALQLVIITLSFLGNLYIGDQANYFIRKVTASTTIISSIAGNNVCSYNGDSIAATSASICPTGVAVDASGEFHPLLLPRIKILTL